MHPSPPVAIVTGASAGIGLELARMAAADGYRTLLVARRRDPLEALAAELQASGAPEPIVAPMDLQKPEAAEQVLEAAGGGAVGMLINNAGFGTFGSFRTTPLERTLELIQLNITALTGLTKLCLDGMVERRTGFVMNVASTASFMPGPGMAAYYASKAYVRSLSEALSHELAGTGVVVSALCPGPTATEFQGVAGIDGSSWLSQRTQMTARDVARIGYRGLMAGKSVVVTGWFNKATIVVPRLAPRRFVTKLVGSIQSTDE